MLEQPPVVQRSRWPVMLDIDRFNEVDDGDGRVVGDRVLQAVAEVLRGCVADPAQGVARSGGEAFALLLPQCTPELALALARTRRQRVKALKVHDRRTRSVVPAVTTSAGIAAMREADDAREPIARADAALYAARQARQAGRDRVQGG